MKTKRTALGALLLFFIPTLTIGCRKLHIHDYQWKYNADEHWQECSKCGDKVNVDSHNFNSFNDTCFTCGYVDPICVVDSDRVMTGLTTYGKTKGLIDNEELTKRNVSYVGDHAFKGSKANKVVLPKSLVGVYKTAFDDVPDCKVTTEEAEEGGEVRWIEYDGVYYKYDIFSNSEAKIEGKFYSTFKEAVESVTKDGTTITLLKDVSMSAGSSIDVKYDIVLEPFQSVNKNLNCNFNIQAGASIKIPSTITYTGTTKLILAPHQESKGAASSTIKSYTSGSLLFVRNNEEEIEPPKNVSVYYVFEGKEDDLKIVALGATQIVKEAVVVRKPYYAYGTFKFNTDIERIDSLEANHSYPIVGLTEFGATVSELTVSSAFGIYKEQELCPQNVEIGDWAFTTETTITIKIPTFLIGDIKIKLDQQKGIYRKLILGSGCTRAGTHSCSNWYDSSQLPKEVMSLILPIVAPLNELVIGPTVDAISGSAFYFCTGLTNVIAEENSALRIIGESAFNECNALKTVNLANCLQLNRIEKWSFNRCFELSDFIFPTTIGWSISDGCGYRPSDLENSKVAANIVSKQLVSKEWNRTLPDAQFCYYNPNEKDENGRYMKVKYAKTFQDAYNGCDGSSNENVICCVEPQNPEGQDPKPAITIKDFTFSKNIRLTAEKNAVDFVIGSGNSVSQSHYLILDDTIKIGDIVIDLKCNRNGDDFGDVAGLAIKQTVSSKNNNLEVHFHNSNQQIIATSSKGELPDGKSYDFYGMFDFKTGCPSSDKTTIYRLSALGNKASSFIVTYPTNVLSQSELVLADNPFSNTNAVRKIIFDEGVKHIGRHILSGNVMDRIEYAEFRGVRTFEYRSFVSCHQLQEVVFTDYADLETLGEKSFCDCPKLKKFALPKNPNLKLKKICKYAFQDTPLDEFDFGYIASGWKAGNKTFTEDELKDKAKAAQYLKKDYKNNEWNRA